MTETENRPAAEVEVTFADGHVRAIPAPAGLSLMEALRAAETDAVLALCGGNCSCGTCHVLIDPAFLAALPGMQIEEDEMLEAVDLRADNSRLSCQLPCAVLPAGLKLTIPPRDD